MCKSVEDYAKRERHVERINAIKNMIKWGVPEDRLLCKYSKVEYKESREKNVEEEAVFGQV